LLKRVIKNSAAMLGSNILLRVGDLVVVILAARRLPVEEFGKYMLVLSFYSLFRLAGDAGMQHLLIRDMAQDKSRATGYFSDALGFQSAWSTLLAAVYVGSAVALGYRGELFWGLLIALLAIIPDNLALVGTAAIQASERLEYLVVVNGASAALRVTTSLAALLLGYGILPVIACMVLSRVLGFVIVQFLATRRILTPPFRTNLRDVATLSRRLLPFLAITLISAVFLRVDAILLASVSGDSAVAVFAVGMRLSEPGVLVAGSFALAIYPTLAGAFTTNRTDFVRLYAGAMRGIIFAGLLVIGIGDCLAPLLVVALFGPRYAAAVPVLKVFLWYLVVFAVDQLNGRVLLAAGRQDVNLKVISIGTILVVILLLSLVPQFGPAGAALADTLTLVAMAAIELVVVSRLVPEVDVKRAVLVPLAGLASVWAAGQLAAHWGWGIQLIVTACLSVVLATLTRLVRAGDIIRLRAAAVGWRAGRAALITE
jgi:O-antigen/teichoic acid export membrane protein